jgi:DNA repair protein RecO (recombination protein O)
MVLGTMDYRETDRLVTLFTMEHGKVRGIAKGAKKSVRRFGGALELFARLSIGITLRDGLSIINHADIVNIFPGVRSDLARIGTASYACELADAMLPDGMPSPRLFRLVTAYLEYLDTSPATASDRRFFEINFLNVLGYCPSLAYCASCGAELDGAAWIHHTRAEEGILCLLCGKGGRQVSGETVALLRNALKTGRFGAVVFSPAALEEAGRVLDSAIASHLNRPLKALSFLREIGEQP